MNQNELFVTVMEIDGNLKKTINQLQASSIFNYRVHKLNRLKKCRAEAFSSGWRLIVLENWSEVLDDVEWAKFEYMEYDFFVDALGENQQKKN